MKKLQKLKLNKLSVEALENREMNQLAGGCTLCTCSCCHQGVGTGSSTSENKTANFKLNTDSYDCSHEDCNTIGDELYFVKCPNPTPYCPKIIIT